MGRWWWGVGGYTMGKLWSRNFLRPPTPTQDRVKLFVSNPPPPFFLQVDFFPPPFTSSVWLQLQAPMIKTPQNMLCPLPSAWLLPLFCRGKTSLAPLLPFCSPPPPPVINDRSLIGLPGQLRPTWRGGHYPLPLTPPPLTPRHTAKSRTRSEHKIAASRGNDNLVLMSKLKFAFL